MDTQQEKEMKELIQQEIQSYMVQKQYSLSKIPAHIHNGVDAPQINQANIKGGQGISGKVTFSQIKTYSIGLAFNPTFVSVEGIVVDSLTAPTIRCLTQGKAYLGGGTYMQPGTSTTTVVGTINDSILQSCSYLSVNTFLSLGANVFHTLASEGHIVSVQYPVSVPFDPTDYHARAKIIGFSSTELLFQVEYLDAGWSMVLNFLIF